MNQPYSHWHTQNSTAELPLAARYRSAEPIRWNGSMVYPMYSKQLGPGSTLVTLKALSAAPPAGLRALGIGLLVTEGFVGLRGKRLGGVDAWSDVLANGITFELTATTAAALFTLTPVWVDAYGLQKSWTGNYGILIENLSSGRIVLWCSVGEGPPNFANLVVEITTAPAARRPVDRAAPADPPTSVDHPMPTAPAIPTEAASPEPDPPADSGYRRALYDLGVAMFGRGEQEHACDLWRQAAEAGHAGAAYDLGVVLLHRGQTAEAERWWRTAADLREPRAMIELADLLEHRGNHTAARAWRAYAAEEQSAAPDHSVDST